MAHDPLLARVRRTISRARADANADTAPENAPAPTDETDADALPPDDDALEETPPTPPITEEQSYLKTPPPVENQTSVDGDGDKIMEEPPGVLNWLLRRNN